MSEVCEAVSSTPVFAVHRILTPDEAEEIVADGRADAVTVVRALIVMQMAPGRLTATGRAYLDPSASNASAQGRARNRRVEIVLPRRGS